MNGEVVIMNDQNEIVEKKTGVNSILEYMDEELKRFNVEENFARCIWEDGKILRGLPEALLFACGFVGSLSYEMREVRFARLFYKRYK